MSKPARLDRIAGLQATVDGIPFAMPVASTEASALVAAFPIDYEAARKAIPGREVFPFRLWSKALLVVTVVDYRKTSIGNYVEYRGKGIWGMPKHQGQLDFKATDTKVSSQYDLDGKLVTYVEIDRPKTWFPMNLGAANYCSFRGMLMKSYIYFQGKAGFGLPGAAKARFILGDHPRAEILKTLQIAKKPIFTAYIPLVHGVLDDYFESWFLVDDAPVVPTPEGLAAVDALGLGKTWLPPPSATVPGLSKE